MIRGLTKTGLGAVGSDEAFLDLAGRYGFTSVDLDPSEMVGRHGVEGVRSLLSQHGVRLGSILLPVEWRTSEEQFRSDLVGLAARLDTAARLGAANFWTYLFPSVDEWPGPFMAVAVRRLRLIAQLLEAFGLPLAMEFLGPRDLRARWKHPFVWNMDQTLDWIGAIDRPNVGLLIDSFHWHTAGHTTADLLKLDLRRVVHVHLGDAPATPADQLPDDDRLYPGEGAIDLVGFLKALQELGYRGIVAQEVLSPRPVTDSTETLLERSRRGFDRVFQAAGLR